MLRRHMQDDRDAISDQNPVWLFYIGDYTTQLSYMYIKIRIGIITSHCKDPCKLEG